MVKIMGGPGLRQLPGSGDAVGDGPYLHRFAEGGQCRIAPDESGLHLDPSICVFWCAVALGALVRGSPLQTVRSANSCADIFTNGVESCAFERDRVATKQFSLAVVWFTLGLMWPQLVYVWGSNGA